ncbi:hypothetical protein ACGFY9_36050 [Streptomyces sp. NPDC048504]|uniref:MmyB family transcriptional regulator n=1 Tax=Streptomyces sp. NPDC048504 TaxID=3365559 RepID=UPI00371B4CA2
MATVAELIGMLRTQVAADPGHPRAVELVGELAVRRHEFAAVRALHDVTEPTRGQMRLDHPQVGELNLDWDAYPIPGNPGPALMVCTDAEGSLDAERLQLPAGLLRAGGKACTLDACGRRAWTDRIVLVCAAVTASTAGDKGSTSR